MIAIVRVHYTTLLAEVGNRNAYPLCFPLFSPPSLSTIYFQRKQTPVSLPCCTNVLILKNGTRTNFSCSASRRWKGKDKGGGLVVKDEEIVIEDDDDDWADDDDSANDEEETEDGEGMFPFDKMRAWLRNKPTGFGVGKTYDISLEEKLLKEIEQSSKAQLMNTSSLKNNLSDVMAPKKLQKHLQENDVPPDGVRVRIGNLPRKKNIRRDLQFAFKEFTGIINISPSVSGNRKTRDPVCKGFAFIDLESEKVAERFVKMYSNQSLLFGKVEKRITCHVMNPPSSLASCRKQLSDNEVNYTSETDATSLTFTENNQGNERYQSEERKQSHGNLVLSSQMIDTEVCSGKPSINFSSSEGSRDQRRGELAVCHSTSSQGMPGNNQSKSKRRKEKPKPQKDRKRSMSGSAIRLKGKERTVLSGVFSKYGGKVAPGSKES